MADPPTTPRQTEGRTPVGAGGAARALGVGGARGNGTKLASAVADRILADISARGWPEGEVIGSEPELLDRYGVSRAVFREAVRLVEHRQVARMRRGPGGGLVVTRPSIDSVADAASVFLYYVGAEIDEVFEARVALEEAAAELAAERIDEAGIAALRRHVRREEEGSGVDHRDLHRLVAGITGNPGLEFFVDLLNRVTLLYLPRDTDYGPEVLAESATAHRAIAEAIIDDDGARARNRMRKHLRAEAAYMSARRPSRRRLVELSATDRPSGKLAEATARQVFAEVAEAGWPVGRLLGSESDLMERYDVSRAVLREAVRLLEYHQVARMRRGPGGGLFVAEPGIEAVTDAIALHVDRGGIEPRHLFEVRGAVEMTVLDRVFVSLGGGATAGVAGHERLADALAAERRASRAEFPVVSHDLHNVLARVAGNRVLELLTDVLTRLSLLRSAGPVGAADPLPVHEVTRVHKRIVEAIIDGDRELARHRMRRHLDALVDWVR